MDKKEYEKLLKQALILETQNRTEFLNNIKDSSIKEKLALVLNDETIQGDLLFDQQLSLESMTDKKVDDFKAGDSIKHFEILELIAKGGMGCVYLARDTKLKRNVALKTIRSEYLHFQINKQRFKIEAEILSQVNHPSICQIYDYIQAEDGDILVLELVKGETLNRYRLNKLELLEVFIQIASALEFAHKNNVIHRDLKPDNIMLNDEGVVKVLDFGIAKSKNNPASSPEKNSSITEFSPSNLTKAGSLMGTLVYMSPEQAQGLEVGKASDIYSFAVIIQELLTQKPVYRLEDTEDLRQQVINAELIEIDTLPKEYQHLISWMTQVEASHRPNATQVGDELKKIRDIPIKKRNKRILSLIIFIVLSLVTVLIWQQWQANIDKVRVQLKNKIEAEIVELQNKLNFIYTLPKHQIDKKIADIDLTRDKIIEFVKVQEYLSAPIKQQLIGASYFANGNYYDSIKYLESAWQSGIRESNLAYQLGYSYQVAFRDGFKASSGGTEISKNDDNEIDMTKKRFEKSKMYFDFYDNNSSSKSWLVESYKHYFNNDYLEALSLINIKESHSKGDYRVFNYLGLIYTDLMKLAYKEKNTETINEYYKKASEAFNYSIDYARSFPIPYSNLCELNTTMIRAKIFNAGIVDQELFTNSTHPCHDAILIYSKSIDLINTLVSFYSGYSEYLIGNGKSTKNELSEALFWNAKALEIEASGSVMASRGILNDLLALQQYENGENPGQTVESALSSYHQAITLNPTELTNNTGNMFYSLMVQMKYQISQGSYPLDLMKQADQLFMAQESSPYKRTDSFGNMYSNYGDLQRLMAKAALLHNKEVDRWLELAKVSYQKSLESVGQMPYPVGGLLALELMAAELKLANNDLQQATLDQLKLSLDKAMELGANLNWVVLLQANYLKLQMQWNQANSNKAEKLFNKADETYLKAIEMYPSDFDSHLARSKLMLAAHQLNLKPKNPSFKEIAQSELKYVLNIIPNHFEAQLLQKQLDQMN
jgi:serine/threonine protein kinase